MANVWPPFNNITSVATANASIVSTTEVPIVGTAITLVPMVDCVAWLVARILAQEITPITPRIHTVDNLRAIIYRTAPGAAAALSLFDIRPPGGEEWRASAEFSTKDSLIGGTTYTYEIRCVILPTRATASYTVLSSATAAATFATRLSAWGLPADGQTY